MAWIMLVLVCGGLAGANPIIVQSESGRVEIDRFGEVIPLESLGGRRAEHYVFEEDLVQDEEVRSYSYLVLKDLISVSNSAYLEFNESVVSGSNRFLVSCSGCFIRVLRLPPAGFEGFQEAQELTWRIGFSNTFEDDVCGQPVAITLSKGEIESLAVRDILCTRADAMEFSSGYFVRDFSTFPSNFGLLVKKRDERNVAILEKDEAEVTQAMLDRAANQRSGTGSVHLDSADADDAEGAEEMEDDAEGEEPADPSKLFPLFLGVGVLSILLWFFIRKRA